MKAYIVLLALLFTVSSEAEQPAHLPLPGTLPPVPGTFSGEYSITAIMTAIMTVTGIYAGPLWRTEHREPYPSMEACERALEFMNDNELIQGYFMKLRPPLKEAPITVFAQCVPEMPTERRKRLADDEEGDRP